MDGGYSANGGNTTSGGYGSNGGNTVRGSYSNNAGNSTSGNYNSNGTNNYDINNLGNIIDNKLDKTYNKISDLDSYTGEVGFGESLIPVWGSWRLATYNLSQGNYKEWFLYSGLFAFETISLGYGSELTTGAKIARTSPLIDDASKTGANVVYHSVEGGVTKYVGITNDLARRAAEQLTAKGIKIEPLMKNLSREDARAVEQALIEIHGLEKNGGTLLNKINSISKTNPTYSSQLQRGYELLKSIGYH